MSVSAARLDMFLKILSRRTGVAPFSATTSDSLCTSFMSAWIPLSSIFSTSSKVNMLSMMRCARSVSASRT